MIQVEKRAFPGRGKTLIIFTDEGDIKNRNYFIKLEKNIQERLQTEASTHDFTGRKNEHIMIDGGASFARIIVFGTGKEKDLTPSVFREFLAAAVRVAGAMRTPSLHFFLPEKLLKNEFQTGKHLAIGFYLAQYRFSKYKGKEHQKKIHTIKDLYVCCESEPSSALKQGIEEGTTVAKAVMLTRDLVNEPASRVNPAYLVKEAERIARESGGLITTSVLDAGRCSELHMGAYLGVAEGSEREPQFIVMTYTPAGAQKKRKKICFVGKSITFDSGGLSLKPAKAMEDMKIDMAGGAAVLGVFQALAEGIKSPHEIIGILPACENMPSGKAMRPGDIVEAMNGKTIEVLNTDAEGRLALADAVSYAEKMHKPDLIIDFATLTGACMVALGEDVAGVFGNDERAVRKFMECTRQEDEPAWELPFYKPYLELLKSDIADIKNVAGKGYGGAITAALFIGEFVKSTAWVHVDIAGPAHNSGQVRGTVGRGGTGWGVMSIINLIQSA